MAERKYKLRQLASWPRGCYSRGILVERYRKFGLKSLSFGGAPANEVIKHACQELANSRVAESSQGVH
jgi:hypothetical protein